jgi:hypothetical protein
MIKVECSCSETARKSQGAGIVADAALRPWPGERGHPKTPFQLLAGPRGFR